MKPLHRAISLLLMLCTLLIFPRPALAQPTAAGEGPLTLPLLRAVVVVGSINGDTSDWTKTEINNMEMAAKALEAHGVLVSRFYTPSDRWDSITAAAAGAQFFLYSGHGVYWPDQNLVGGLYIHDENGEEVIISPDQIRKDLHLGRNAIVMLYGCWTTGTSGDETNTPSADAQTRVAQYSSPFFDAGARGYYADWNTTTFATLIDLLFAGNTQGDGFKATGSFNPAGAEYYNYPLDSNLAMWLDKDVSPSGSIYDYAFAGQADAQLIDLFGVNTANMPLRLYLPLLVR